MSKQNVLSVRVYHVLSRAVSEGVSQGYARAHKHTPNPEPDRLKEQIENAVLMEICDVFDVDNSYVSEKE